MLCGTVTYPLAVRVARRLFRLKGFYAIHLTIAPFLGVVHVNIFGSTNQLMTIWIVERDFQQLRDQNLFAAPVLYPHYHKVVKLAKAPKNYSKQPVIVSESLESLVEQVKEQDERLGMEIESYLKLRL